MRFDWEVRFSVPPLMKIFGRKAHRQYPLAMEHRRTWYVSYARVEIGTFDVPDVTTTYLLYGALVVCTHNHQFNFIYLGFVRLTEFD